MINTAEPQLITIPWRRQSPHRYVGARGTVEQVHITRVYRSRALCVTGTAAEGVHLARTCTRRAFRPSARHQRSDKVLSNLRSAVGSGAKKTFKSVRHARWRGKYTANNVHR